MRFSIDLIRTKLKEENLDAFLVSNPFNRRYVTGFTGSTGFAWVSKNKAAFLTDFRYIEQVKEQCPGWEIVRVDDDYNVALENLRAAEGVERIGVEADHITVSQFSDWQEKWKATPVAKAKWFEKWRMVKTEDEVEKVANACQIADKAFDQILPLIKSGVSERDLAVELKIALEKNGGEGLSFDPIVASGARGALPHARPSEKILYNGDFVVFDFGCIYKGYCSDMTRTVLVGTPEEKHLVIYDLVLKAQMAALEAIRPGKTGVEVDNVAREIIKDGGYGNYFGHGLGHGVGLEVHEEPRLSPKGQTILQPGMVVSVEPGIYLPGWGGVRIEDLVVVTEDGCRVLTSTFKEMYTA